MRRNRLNWVKHKCKSNVYKEHQYTMYVYFLIKEFNGNWWSLAYIPSALHDKYLPVVNVSIQGMNSINITIIVIQNLYLQLSNKFRLKLIVKVYILARNT